MYAKDLVECPKCGKKSFYMKIFGGLDLGDFHVEFRGLCHECGANFRYFHEGVVKGGIMKSTAQFHLRIPPEVHKRLSDEAQKLGISLNALINMIIKLELQRIEESEGKER